jgi:hypothetical protein
MRLEDFETVLGLVVRSGLDEVRMLGGEPTLHPEFPSMVRRARARGLRVRVFSNGLMPPAALSALQELAPEHCAVLVNVPSPPGDEGARARERTLQALGPRAEIGINLYRPGLPIAESFALVDQHQLRRTVRLGLAHPCLGADNAYLHPRSYGAVGRELTQLARVARDRGIVLTFDCGFVPCMFPIEFWELASPAAADIGRQCGPIPDILPDLAAVHCYALGNLEQLPISGAATAQEIARRFRAPVQAPQTIGIYRECARCAARRESRCTGGCRAAALRRYHGWASHPVLSTTDGRRKGDTRVARASGIVAGRSPAVGDAASGLRSPQEPRGDRRWVLPYIDQGRDFWTQLAAEFGSRVAAVYFPLPGVPNGRPVQPARRLREFLQQDSLPKNVLINPVVLPTPADEFFRGISGELQRLIEEYGVTSATVADFELARLLRGRFPQLQLTASVLMGVSTPEQARAAAGVFDAIVPGSGLVRQPARLAALRAAYPGTIRLLVNEACLPGCDFRHQHFFEMAYGSRHPESLCAGVLAQRPWLRLTGAWVLPQHLHLLAGLADEFKLAGRATLHDPGRYLRVCRSYLHATALWPDEIGGGPASLLGQLPISLGLARYLQDCDHDCERCSVCRRLVRSDAVASVRPASEDGG